jgi:hypothetical protein
MIFNNLNFFEHHTFCIICIYSFVYLFEIFVGKSFNNNWELKFIGAIIGYYFNDIIIKTHNLNRNLYFKNFIKSFSILVSQSVVLKLLLSSFNILGFLNIVRINLYLFVNILLDIISDVVIDDNNINKEMYIDMIRTGIGFIIVESFIHNKITSKDYLYILILCTGLLIYYKKIVKYRKEINLEK